MVVADLRAFYRSTGPVRPISLSGMARRRPGDYAMAETAQDYVLGARAWPGQADEAVRAVFSKGGACFDCHVVLPVPSKGAPVTIQKVVQPERYMKGGWFDHDAHKSETCISCHSADKSNLATDLLLPDLNSCRTCHVGGTGDHLKPVKTPVISSCAMCHDYHVDGQAPWMTKMEVGKGKGSVRFPAVAAKR
jgi:DnaJ-class molecular chaperone